MVVVAAAAAVLAALGAGVLWLFRCVCVCVRVRVRVVDQRFTYRAWCLARCGRAAGAPARGACLLVHQSPAAVLERHSVHIRATRPAACVFVTFEVQAGMATRCASP